jgi:hypothetical protein
MRPCPDRYMYLSADRRMRRSELHEMTSYL